MAQAKKTDQSGVKRALNISPRGWLVISFVVAMIVLYLLSINPKTARSFPNMVLVLQSLPVMIDRGVFFKDIASSLTSVAFGFLFGFILSLPNAILMAWYKPYRNIVEPWIQFIRNIPPLAYVPLVVISAGPNEKASAGGLGDCDCGCG